MVTAQRQPDALTLILRAYRLALPARWRRVEAQWLKCFDLHDELIEVQIGRFHPLISGEAPFAAVLDVDGVAAAPAERPVVDGVELLGELGALGADEKA